jgi:hypothetical protein
MSLLRTCLVIAVVGLVGVACSSDLTVGTPDSGADTSDNMDSGGSNEAGPDTSVADTGVDTGLACPDESGAYSVVLSGAGCGDTSMSAPQCLRQTGCQLTFVSASATSAKALNGDPTIGADGSFTNGNIQEGTTNRSGCVGAWDQGTSTLTVVCGGDAGSQSCAAKLTRTAPKCP